MILDGVDVFVKVVQAGGFSAAARQLGMPATTVSAKIARLEERLGVTLLRRTTRRMSVTPAGEAYFAHCVEAVRALEVGEEQLFSATAEPSGPLRITAPPDLAQVLLPALVLSYAERYPKTRVDLVVTNTPLDLIAEGVDLAVRASPLQDSTLTSRRFVSAPLWLWASKGYLDRHGRPKTPKDLDRHALLRHSRMPAGSARLVSGKRSFSMGDNGRVRADDMQTLRALAEGGGGIALLPDFSGVQSGQVLERVLPGYATEKASVYFVYAAQKFVPVNVRSFVDLAIAAMRAAGVG
jgi:DNA-binding transcriptional LysR family regulator